MRFAAGVLASFAVVLAGCAGPHFTKAGASEEEYQRQLARCRVVAAQTPSGDGAMGAMIVEATLQNCMRAEGYIRDN